MKGELSAAGNLEDDKALVAYVSERMTFMFDRMVGDFINNVIH